MAPHQLWTAVGPKVAVMWEGGSDLSKETQARVNMMKKTQTNIMQMTRVMIALLGLVLVFREAMRCYDSIRRETADVNVRCCRSRRPRDRWTAILRLRRPRPTPPSPLLRSPSGRCAFRVRW
jgi:hypothetical protein